MMATRILRRPLARARPRAAVAVVVVVRRGVAAAVVFAAMSFV